MLPPSSFSNTFDQLFNIDSRRPATRRPYSTPHRLPPPTSVYHVAASPITVDKSRPSWWWWCHGIVISYGLKKRRREKETIGEGEDPDPRILVLLSMWSEVRFLAHTYGENSVGRVLHSASGDGNFVSISW
ncbi:hypothetical protein A2U01_0003015 [Trifolium medium]|uniref:Uncharacterized protein n=1 Tax=Trifolium medium TaxID=97028 RepID=A0A392M4G5_9FABA|nr:hypothetical protein [Trifolium medium]